MKRGATALGLAAGILFSACGLDVGDPLPEFSVRAPGGEAVSTAAFRGHVVVLDLWSPGCFACVAELPRLQRIQDALGSRGLRVVGLYDRAGPRDGRLVGDGMGVGFPLVHVGAGLMRRLGGWEFPTTLVIDAEGRVRRIVHGDPGEAVLREMATALLP